MFSRVSLVNSKVVNNVELHSYREIRVSVKLDWKKEEKIDGEAIKFTFHMHGLDNDK
jgi:hypothetical protein